MVTVRDIAKEAGVSISTVSRVLNNYHKVSEDTRRHVLDVIETLGYERIDRAEEEEQLRIVGIVLPLATGSDIMTHPTVYSILSSISHRLNECGIRYSILMIDHESDSEYLNILREDIDAFVLLNTRQVDEDALIPRILENKKPVIVVNRWLTDNRISYANIDDIQASFTATEYLIKLGHHRISLVNGDPTFRNSRMRLEGYVKALKKYDIPSDPGVILDGSYSEEWGRQAAMRIHEMSMKPTALHATSDIIALGLHKTFLKLGYHLPDDMSIVGFGDVEFASYLHPSLTTIRVPVREIGMHAADVIKHLLESKSIRYMKVALEAEMIIRESVAPFKDK